MVKRLIKTLYKNCSMMDDIVKDKLVKRSIRCWEAEGSPIPPPDCVKQLVVRGFAKRHRISTLVETGTFLGDMIHAVRRDFREIYSIELSRTLYQNALERFAGHRHIQLLNGDSGVVLAALLRKIKEPCVFWLDGHYSGGITARGDKDTPVVEELSAIFSHAISDHVILIDDARLFNGSNDYPHLEWLEKHVKEEKPDFVFGVESDIIYIHKG